MKIAILSSIYKIALLPNLKILYQQEKNSIEMF